MRQPLKLNFMSFPLSGGFFSRGRSCRPEDSGARTGRLPSAIYVRSVAIRRGAGGPERLSAAGLVDQGEHRLVLVQLVRSGGGNRQGDACGPLRARGDVADGG